MTQAKKKSVNKSKKSNKPAFEKEFKKEAKAAVKEIKSVGKKIAGKCRQAKKKFDALDSDKKKKILAGVIGVATIAAGISAGIIAKSKKKNRT
jgi:hypothetical protein